MIGLQYKVIAAVLFGSVITDLSGSTASEIEGIEPVNSIVASRGCNVESILTQVDVPIGSLAVGGISEVVEVDMLLVPTTLEAGLYKVTITRKVDDLYEIIGENLYVRTRYCFEYGYSVDALLELQTYSGGNLGKVTFL